MNTFYPDGITGAIQDLMGGEGFTEEYGETCQRADADGGLTDSNARIVFTRQAHTVGDSAHTTSGKPAKCTSGVAFRAILDKA